MISPVLSSTRCTSRARLATRYSHSPTVPLRPTTCFLALRRALLPPTLPHPPPVSPEVPVAAPEPTVEGANALRAVVYRVKCEAVVPVAVEAMSILSTAGVGSVSSMKKASDGPRSGISY